MQFGLICNRYLCSSLNPMFYVQEWAGITSMQFSFRLHISLLTDQCKSPDPHYTIFRSCTQHASDRRLWYHNFSTLTFFTNSTYLTFLPKLSPIRHISLPKLSTSVFFVYTCQSTYLFNFFFWTDINLHVPVLYVLCKCLLSFNYAYMTPMWVNCE